MEPDSTLLVALLIVIACGAIYAAVRFRMIAIKVLCGLVAVTFAAVGGVTMVNVYYGYYQNWSQLSADLTNSYTQFNTATPAHRQHGHVVVGQGRVEQFTFTGRLSHITRQGFVYLPPQYFQPQYAHTRFPVVELLHGSPGTPLNWVLQINIESIMNQLIARNLVGPMIIAMPAINSGNNFQDCTDAPGALDGTYISQDVPADVRSHFRAAELPADWGIGGYSSGGYCAANLAMRDRSAFGAVGVMDGYYRPTDGPAAAALHFNKQLEAANDPLAAAQRLTTSARPLPSFWVSAGTEDARYALGARAFVKALHGIEAVSYTVEPGQGHNFYAWRPAVPRLLSWMWTQIAPPQLRVQFPIAGPVTNKIVLAPRKPTSSSSSSPSSSASRPTAAATHARS